MYCDVGNLQICVYTGVRKVTPPYARCCTLHTQAQAHGTLSHSPTHYSDNRGGSKQARARWELGTANWELRTRISSFHSLPRPKKKTAHIKTAHDPTTKHFLVQGTTLPRYDHQLCLLLRVYFSPFPFFLSLLSPSASRSFFEALHATLLLSPLATNPQLGGSASCLRAKRARFRLPSIINDHPA